MPTYTQQGRQMEITTPLGADALLLTGFEGSEEFNRLFHYKLRMLSTNNAIAAKDIVGKNVTFSITLRDKSPRYFNGYISRFAFKGMDDRFSVYHAEVVPWTWFLTQTKDCRIFQAKTVPQIIQEVLKDFSMAKVDASEIRGTHEQWEYCVQYRESDFDFIARLMEQEGIYYYFVHDNGVHTMILGDTARGYKDADEKSATLKDNFSGGASSDNLLDWERVYEFRPAKFAHADYNFETPSANMVANAAGAAKVPGTDQFEIFEYPGGYETKTQGEADARLRVEEIAAGTDVVHGRSVNASWGPGFKFTVDQHHIEDEEGNSYVLCSVAHEASLTGEYTAVDAGELEYTNTFTAIDAAKPFRPERVTPKPFVHGPQTALVVGAPGDLIPVDKYGRVKVSFFWDRRSKKDDTSSCWIRVSQTSGGAGWGGMFHPHAGHEVIVSFIEGDPDRPIITGRVYNAERDHPLDAVVRKTRSAIRDHGGNKLIMEGADGNQRVHMHCPRHDSSIVLGNSITINSDSDFIGGFTKNERFTFGGSSEKIVGGHLSMKIGYPSEAPEDGKAEGFLEALVSWVKGPEEPLGPGDFQLEAKKNIIIKAEGYKEEEIKGNTTHLKKGEINIEHMLGVEHKTILGLSSEMIGGMKLEVVTGIEFEYCMSKRMHFSVFDNHLNSLTGEVHVGSKKDLHVQSKSDSVHIHGEKDVHIAAKSGKVEVKSPTVHVEGTSALGLRSDNAVYLSGKTVKIGRANASEVQLTASTVKLNGNVDINDGAVTVEGSVVSADDFKISEERIATNDDYAKLLNSVR